jgi:signal transduction histidine kinase
VQPGFGGGLERIVPWRMYNTAWCLAVYPTPLFEARSPRRMAMVAGTAAGGITLLASVLVWVALRARFRQEHIMLEVLEARDALSASLRERERIGHDLHDGAIQSLYAVQLGLTRTAGAVESTLPQAAQVLHETRVRLDEVIAELRQFILKQEAQDKIVAPPKLADVLRSMMAKLQATTSAELKLEADPLASDSLSLSQTVQLTQIARSAIANALRHAEAGSVRVNLARENDGVLLAIEDDGKGFDPSKVPASTVGLSAMRRRAEDAGAVFSLDSSPGRGTRIRVRLPAANLEPSVYPESLKNKYV